MLQPTGSVYLDTPRSLAHLAPEPESRLRVVLSGTLAAIGLVCLTLAAVLGAFRAVIHDTDTVMGSVDQAIDDPAARAELEGEIAAAITGTLFGEDLEATLASVGVNLDAEAARIAPLVLDDPAFRAALTDLVVETHERVLLTSSDAPLDMTEITTAARDVIIRELPDAALVLPASSTLYIVTADQIPDLTAPVDLLDRAALAVAAGGILLPLAALAHPRRDRVAAWIGRWALAMGILAVGLAFGLPWLAQRFTGSTLVEIVVQDLGTRLIAPAAIFGLIGVGLVVTASVMGKRQRHHAADEGVVAALGGFDDSFAITGGVSQDMDLAHRGLVDVSHPLTNI